MGNKVFEVGKWVLIVVLGVLIVYLLKTNRELNSSNESYRKDGTYMRTYDSQTISSLKKQNIELYDSIKGKQDVKQAIIVKYKYVYNGDTVYLDRKIGAIKGGPLTDNSPAKLLKDSTYNFSGGKLDSLSYKLKINSPIKPNWYKLDFTINDKLTLINRENGGKNELSIGTNGGKIEGASVFNKSDNRDSFINRFSLGIQAGAGYGILTKKPDLFVGFGISYRLNKLK